VVKFDQQNDSLSFGSLVVSQPRFVKLSFVWSKPTTMADDDRDDGEEEEAALDIFRRNDPNAVEAKIPLVVEIDTTPGGVDGLCTTALAVC